MSEKLVLAESQNRRFLAELLAQLQKNALIRTSNARIEENQIVCDPAIKKNNITYKQLQVGIDFFREGWNRHRMAFSR